MTNICGGIGWGEVACGELTFPVWDLWVGDIDSQQNLPSENSEITAEIATEEAENDNSLEGDPDSIIGLTIER